MRIESLDDYLDGCSESFDLAARGTRDVEFDWFARDAVGNLALLTTGGHLAVPLEVLRDKEAYLRVCAAFHQLPERGTASLKRPGVGDFEDWLRASRRGLYSYDWNHDLALKDVYCVVATPTSAVPVTELSAAGVGLLTFAGTFAEAERVAVSQFRCSSRGSVHRALMAKDPVK